MWLGLCRVYTARRINMFLSCEGAARILGAEISRRSLHMTKLPQPGLKSKVTLSSTRTNVASTWINAHAPNVGKKKKKKKKIQV